MADLTHLKRELGINAVLLNLERIWNHLRSLLNAHSVLNPKPSGDAHTLGSKQLGDRFRKLPKETKK
jgi:hypothetical protein